MNLERKGRTWTEAIIEELRKIEGLFVRSYQEEEVFHTLKTGIYIR